VARLPGCSVGCEKSPGLEWETCQGSQWMQLHWLPFALSTCSGQVAVLNDPICPDKVLHVAADARRNRNRLREPRET
jgi:hypothetical protein